MLHSSCNIFHNVPWALASVIHISHSGLGRTVTDIIFPFSQSYPFLPTVIDGVLLPKSPEEILAEKSFNTVPYMVGITKHEFGWLIPMVRTNSLLYKCAHSHSHHEPPAAQMPFSYFSVLWNQNICPHCHEWVFPWQCYSESTTIPWES